MKVFKQSELLPAFSSLLLEKNRLCQLVFGDVLQRLMNISFKIEVCSTVYDCSPIIDGFLCRLHTIAVGISSDMRMVVDKSQVIFVIWGVLKVSSWMLPQYFKSIFKCLTQLVLFSTSLLEQWQNSGVKKLPVELNFADVKEGFSTTAQPISIFSWLSLL